MMKSYEVTAYHKTGTFTEVIEAANEAEALKRGKIKMIPVLNTWGRRAAKWVVRPYSG